MNLSRCASTGDMFTPEDGESEPEWVITERKHFAEFRDTNKVKVHWFCFVVRVRFEENSCWVLCRTVIWILVRWPTGFCQERSTTLTTRPSTWSTKQTPTRYICHHLNPSWGLYKCWSPYRRAQNHQNVCQQSVFNRADMKRRKHFHFLADGINPIVTGDVNSSISAVELRSQMTLKSFTVYKRGLMLNLFKGDIPGFGGIWDGPSHVGNVYCSLMHQYSRSFLNARRPLDFCEKEWKDYKGLKYVDGGKT